MPQKDRTFSSTDVIRIVEKHLTPLERDEVILILCELTDLEVIIRFLKIILDAIEQINNLIRPVRKWLTRIPWLRPIIIIIDFAEVIIEAVIHLLEIFESISNSKKSG